MIIDSHQHFWLYDPVRDAWIDDSMKVIKRDFLPKDFAPILKENGVEGCVAVQADQSEAETQFLLDCAASNPFIKGVVGWVDLIAENVEERIQHFAKNKLFKGIRHIVQAEKDDYLLREDVQRGISILSKYQLTFDILVFPQQLTAAIELVAKFPNQKFVLDHIAKPKISEAIDREWISNINALAKHKNVYCKLSGMVTETTNFSFEEKDFITFIDTIHQAFGPDRILFGSDWPVCLLAADYQKVLGIVSDYLENYSPEINKKILGANAIKFYNL